MTTLSSSLHRYPLCNKRVQYTMVNQGLVKEYRVYQNDIFIFINRNCASKNYIPYCIQKETLKFLFLNTVRILHRYSHLKREVKTQWSNLQHSYSILVIDESIHSCIYTRGFQTMGRDPNLGRAGFKFGSRAFP